MPLEAGAPGGQGASWRRHHQTFRDKGTQALDRMGFSSLFSGHVLFFTGPWKDTATC